jgi:hypothetical protein
MPCENQGDATSDRAKGIRLLAMMTTCLASLGLLAVLLMTHVARQASRRPEGSVVASLGPPAPGRRRVVCSGDSLTHGVVSFDYVGALRRLVPDGGRLRAFTTTCSTAP